MSVRDPVAFATARRACSVEDMRGAFERLRVSHAVMYGMTEGQVEAVLGPADYETGIYCPGGTSKGYGCAGPESESPWPHYFWLHYRAPDYDQPAVAGTPPTPYELVEECGSTSGPANPALQPPPQSRRG